MNRSQHLNVLRRLFYLQCFSLPRFVASASPHIVAGDEHLLRVLEKIVRRQEHMASLVANAILMRQGHLPRATFPMHYTGLHDLGIRYLLTCILEEQRTVVSELHVAVSILAGDAEAQDLARELRRSETAYLALFEELCSSHRRGDPTAVDSRNSTANHRLPSVSTSANGLETSINKARDSSSLAEPLSIAC
jgi:hypothetical protein